MLKQIIFISIFSIVSVNLFGQEKITLKEEKVSDLMPRSLYRTNAVGYFFKVGEGEYEAVGYKGKAIEEVLKTDTEAYKEFEKFQKKVTGAKVFAGVSIASPFGWLLSIDYDNDDAQDFARKGIVAAVVYTGSLVTSMILYRNAPKHLVNAVEIYNQNLE